MNFLAHVFLSGNSNAVKIGNFIGDFVKGKDYDTFPVEVRKGILLHRFIDFTTDKNDIVKEVQTLFKPSFKRYSGVIVDMVFDYFLATNWQQYSSVSLHKFCADFYWQLMAHFFILPNRVKLFAPNLIANNRLESYKTTKGLKKALDIMAFYTSLPDNSMEVIDLIELNHRFINERFNAFFPEIMAKANEFCNATDSIH